MKCGDIPDSIQKRIMYVKKEVNVYSPIEKYQILWNIEALLSESDQAFFMAISELLSDLEHRIAHHGFTREYCKRCLKGCRKCEYEEEKLEKIKLYNETYPSHAVWPEKIRHHCDFKKIRLSKDQ